MKFVVLFVLAIALVEAATMREQFTAFKTKFGKSYPTVAEHEKRFQIFEQNVQAAEMKNRVDRHATWGVTKFSDLTPKEFADTYLMKNVTFGKYKATARTAKVNILPNLPSEFDWGDKGMLTAVKNQEQCGSCWDFSTTETIESVWAIAGNALTELSEQQILDCDTTDQGCNGGDPPTAYQYVMSAGGLETEQDYPYTAEDGTCQAQPSEFVAKISNWEYVTQSDDENAMQNFCYQTAPISICVDAETWQSYSGGVITPDSGCGDSLDHCVQITGWQQMQGMSVWNVRNSWGTDWGVNGYIYLQIGSDVCGCADEATCPEV
jgi:cathepsin F